jgi:hypothetical protein
MGHLFRSASVAQAIRRYGIEPVFLLRGDARAIELAKSLGLTMGSHEHGRPMVIDATTVSPEDAELAMTADPRVLISPVFDRPDLLSHVLVRSVPVLLRKSLGPTVEVIERPEYAFATAHGLVRRDLRFNALRVGICLSGGNDPPYLDRLIRVVSCLPTVAETRVIRHDPVEPQSLDARCRADVRERGFTTSPWSYFSRINLFVGGHGVMVAEAIAQGIPTISVGPPECTGKNEFLAETGALVAVDDDFATNPTLVEVLSDPKQLQALHTAARILVAGGATGTLAEDVYRILAH